MPCDILYNGKRYTLAEFVKLLSENELINKINDNTITGSLADGYRKSFAAEFPSPETQIKKEYDTENKPRVGGEVRVGEKPVETEPKPGAGREAAPTGRDVQGDITAKKEKLGGQVGETKEDRDASPVTASELKAVESIASPQDKKANKGKNLKPNKIFTGINTIIQDVADKFRAKIKSKSPRLVTSVSESDAKRIADAYEKVKHDPDNPEVKKAFAELITEIKKQADVLLAEGFKFQLANQGEGYNGNSKKMFEDVRNNKRIFIDPSSESFGTTREFDKDNIGLQDSGYKDVNGVPLTNVELIRAVHDLFGHSEYGNGFGAIGEENAWRVHMSMFSPLAQKALTITTRGQNSWVNFGPHMRNADGSIKKKGDPGYLEPSQRPFAEQKIGFLPDWAMDNSYGDMVIVNDKQVKPVNKYVVDGKEVYEIDDAQAFYDAITEAKRSRGADGIQVYVKSVDEYADIVKKGGHLLISKDGKSGMIVEADGNAGSGFAHNDIPKGQNTLAPLLVTSIKLGARYTDAYDTYLPPYYAKFGFKPSGRMKFDPDMAEKGWDQTILKDKPDVVFMYWDGGDRTDIENRIGTFPKYSKTEGAYETDYDAAVEKARSKSEKLEPESSLVPSTAEIAEDVTEEAAKMPFQDQVKSDMESGEYSLYVDGESAGVKNFDDAMDLIERMDLQDGEVLYIKDATGKSFATIDNKGNVNPYESSSLEYDTQKSEIAEKYGEDNQVLKALENASKALKKNSPDAKIYIHDNSESLANAVSQVTGKDTSAYATDNGHIVMDKDGNVVEVHFAMDGANKVTVYHEIIHPILTSAIGNDVNVMKEMVNAAKSILSEADIKSLEQFIKQYDGDLTKADEFLTELGARITANTVKFKDKAWLDKVKSFINDISKKYAGVTVFEKTDNENIVRDFFRTMSEGLTSSKVDKETLSKKIEEFRLKKTILNPDVAPDVEPGNQIGGSADGLNKSSRDLEKARVKWFNTTPKGDKGDVKMVYPDPVAIEEVFEKSGGAVVFVNSDATKVGTVEINGRKFKLYGGFDYTFIEQNVKDGIGFAASADNKIENLKTIATAIANKRDKLNPQHKGKPVAVFVVSHNGEAMLGEWYASEYIMEGLDVSLSKKKYPGGLRAAKKNFRDAINNVEISTKKEENKKEAALRDKLLGMIDSGEFDTHEGRMRIAKFLAGKDVSFAFRVKLNGSIMPNQGNKKASKNEKNRELRDALSKAGHFLNDFWQKFADERFLPRLNETKLQDKKNKVFGGMSFSGFYYDPKTSFEKQVEHSKGGIEHQQFNSSFKSEGNFLLNSAYNVNQLFPDAGFPFESAYQLYNKEHGTNFVKKTTEVADKMAITEWLLKNGKSKLISPPATMASQSIYSGVADANMKPVLNEYVEAVDTPKPVKKPVISKASKGQRTALPGKNLVPKSYDIDADKEGNYLFYHYGNIEGNKIDPKNWGKNAYTSDKRFHGVSYYYTKGNQKEMVVGGDAHVVAVPKYQVYPFNKDPLNFYDQAEKNFRKEFPNGAFDAVRQIDFMNPLIAKAGFKMVVAEWGEFPLRAETTLPLSYDKKKTEEFRKFGGFEGSLRKEKYAQDILNELSEKANTSKGVASGLNEAFYDAGGLNADVDKLLSNPKIKAQVSKKAISNYEGESKAQKKEEGKGSKLKAAAEQAAKEAEMEAAEPSVPSPETGMKRSKFAKTVEEAREGISPLVKEIFEAQGAMYVPKTIKDSAMSANELWNEILDVHDGNLDAAVKNAYVIIMNDDWGGKPEQIGMLGGMVAKKLNEMSQEPGISMEKIAQNESMAVMILTKIRQRMTNAGSETSQVGKFMKDMFMAYPEAVVSYVYTEIDTKNDLAFGSPTREFSGTMEQIVADIMSTEEGRLAMEQLGIGKKNKINKKYTDKKKAISDAFDRVINDIDSLSNGVSFAVPIPPVVIKSGLKAMKKAVLSGLDIAKAVELAVDEVSTQMQGIDFDKNKARAFFKNLADKIMGDVDNNANPEFVTEQMRKKLDEAYQQKVEKAKKALADFEKKKEQRKKLDEQKEADAQAKKEAKEAERAAGRAAREAEKQRAAFEDSLNKLKGDKLRQFAFNIAKNFGNGAANVSQTDVIRAFHQAMGGVQLTAQQQAQLSQAAKTIAAANKLSSQASPSSSQQVINQWIQAQHAASQAAAQINRMLNPRKWIDLFQSTMVMGFITFKTLGANPVSNAIHKLYSSFYDDMLFSFVDVLYAPGQSTTFVQRFKSLFNFEPTKAYIAQLPQAVKRAFNIMKEGSPARDVDRYGGGYEMKPLTAWQNLIGDVKSTPGFIGKINEAAKGVYEGTLGLTTATMSRALSAGDIASRDPEAARTYKKWADDMGVDVDEFLTSDEFAEYRYYALEYAKRITFQQENIVSKFVGKRIPKKTKYQLFDWFNLLVVKPIVPFFGTPINIKHEMLTMIPTISFTESMHHAQMAKDTKLPDAERFFHAKMAQKMMRRAVGSLPLYAAVSALLASGLMYIIPRGDEEDEAEKETMKAFEGMGGRVVFKGTESSIDGLKFGPLFDYIILIDNVNKKYAETESVSAATMEGLISTTRSTIDNTYLQGLKNAVEGFSNPEKKLPTMFIDTYGSAYANLLFPTLLSALTQMSDKEKVLRLSKDESFLKSLYNKVIRERIGFIDSEYTDIEKLPARVNVLGEPIKTDREGRVDIIHYLFDITRSQPYRPEEKPQIEIYKNYLKTENKEWLYPVAPRNVTFEKEDIKLTPELRNEYQKMLGSSISSRLQKKYGQGQKVPAGIKLESFVKIKTDQSESVKKEFMEKYKSQIQDLYKEKMEQKSKAGPREIFRSNF